MGVQWHISRYALALASVALALGVALLTWHYGIRHQFSVFPFAIAVTAWYFGTGPAMSKVDGPRELLIKSQRCESDSVFVAVRDNGAGFDEQKADQLFEAF
jgi:membrane protein required for beta-lactamase induction